MTVADTDRQEQTIFRLLPVQVVLRNGVAINAEVPDYSELDTVPNERRYTADQPSDPPAPSDPPSVSPSDPAQVQPVSASASKPSKCEDVMNGVHQQATAVQSKV